MSFFDRRFGRSSARPSSRAPIEIGVGWRLYRRLYLCEWINIKVLLGRIIEDLSYQCSCMWIILRFKYIIYPIPGIYPGLTLAPPLVPQEWAVRKSRNQPKPNHKSPNTDFQNQCRQLRTVKVDGASQVPWGRFTLAT